MLHFELSEIISHFRLKISGGDLNSNYSLAQFHFHWGSESSLGSEHMIDGERHFAEIHLVHFKVRRLAMDV